MPDGRRTAGRGQATYDLTLASRRRKSGLPLLETMTTYPTPLVLQRQPLNFSLEVALPSPRKDMAGWLCGLYGQAVCDLCLLRL